MVNLTLNHVSVGDADDEFFGGLGDGRTEQNFMTEMETIERATEADTRERDRVLVFGRCTIFGIFVRRSWGRQVDVMNLWWRGELVLNVRFEVVWKQSE